LWHSTAVSAGDIVIVAYRPKPERQHALLALVRDHLPILRGLGLATVRPAIILGGRDGVIIEILEWMPGAMATAHGHPEVLAMWERFAAVCDYVPLKDLPEAATLFAQFVPIEP